MESLYLDTSVPSAYFDERQAERRAITKHFWNVVLPGYKVYISDVTLFELSKAPDPTRRIELRELVRSCEVLPLSKAAKELAKGFIDDGLIKPSKVEDALHLAIAVVAGLETLVSWNFDDMVNFHTKRLLPMLMAKHGYFKQLLIVSPQEF